MSKALDFVSVAALLFIPAGHKNLVDIVTRERYTSLKAVVIDFEDGCDIGHISQGFAHLKQILLDNNPLKFAVFIRPRDPKMLQLLLKESEIEKIDGFVLPKFSLANAALYCALLKGKDFYWMPSIEGEELFYADKLQQLILQLTPYKEKILAVRFGLEDMLRQLQMQRTCDVSVFDIAVTQTVIGNFLALFKSAGFMVSGGVYPCFKDDAGFLKDIQRDLKEGLFGKTLIHPRQVQLANEAYKVSQEEYERSQRVLVSENAVYGDNGVMQERVTREPYAAFIIQRAHVYGIKEEI